MFDKVLCVLALCIAVILLVEYWKIRILNNRLVLGIVLLVAWLILWLWLVWCCLGLRVNAALLCILVLV